MKLLILFFILLVPFLSSCKKSDLVYWCGDHECVNEKERISYFKKTMIVEMKNADKVSKNDKTREKEIKKQLKIQKTEEKLKAKKMKKQAKINEKLKKKEKELKIEKSGFEKNVEQIEVETSKVKVVKKEFSYKTDNFDEIKKKIMNTEKNKPYLDINTASE